MKEFKLKNKEDVYKNKIRVSKKIEISFSEMLKILQKIDTTAEQTNRILEDMGFELIVIPKFE